MADANSFQTVNFQDQEIIFKAGEVATHLYFLTSGSVEMLRPQGHAFAEIPKEKSFGQAAFLPGVIRGATVRAKGDVTCRSISAEACSALLKSHSAFLTDIIEALLLQQSVYNVFRRA
jgi:CRP-like cAMP-binding protein